MKIYTIYSEVCIVIECLCKTILDEEGYKEEDIIRLSHNLNLLLKELGNCQRQENEEIFFLLSKHMETISFLSIQKVFINARYMIHNDEVSLGHISRIEELIIDIDKIYNKYYRFNLDNLVYPDSM